jgi:hypothetical protein
VHDAGLVRGVEGLARAAHDVGHEPERQTDAERGPAPPIELGEVDAVDVLLDEVRGVAVDARVEGVHDARARDARHEPGLGQDARLAGVVVLEVGEHRLHHDGDRERPVAREPHAAHSAATDASPQLVARGPVAEIGQRLFERGGRERRHPME